METKIYFVMISLLGLSVLHSFSTALTKDIHPYLTFNHEILGFQQKCLPLQHYSLWHECLVCSLSALAVKERFCQKKTVDLNLHPALSLPECTFLSHIFNAENLLHVPHLPH